MGVGVGSSAVSLLLGKNRCLGVSGGGLLLSILLCMSG